MTVKKLDYILLVATAALVVFGVLIMADVSASLSMKNFGTTYHYLFRQLMNIGLGLILGFLAFKINLDLLKKYSPHFLLGALLLMVMVFLPKVGISAGGSTRWINLGFTSFQPSEFLKLAFILYLASWLSSRTAKKNKIGNQAEKGFGQTLLAFMAVLGVIGIILYLQPDMSTFLIIVCIAIVLYFLAQTPFLHTLLLLLIGGGLFAFFIPRASYRLQRILVFLNPENDPLGIGYHLKQAKIAIGSGGIFGLGLGMSQQKFGFLPESMTDSIFAILAEETGFLGCATLIIFFLAFLWRGFKTGKDSGDNFLKLTAFGITFWIFIQTLINISSMVGFFPLSGIPLPFFSYGGSAIISELIGVGILLNISKTKI